MPRLISVTVPQKALLHIPDLVGIAPVPPTQRVRGRKDFDLRPELMVGHKVEFIISAKISSDGLRRRHTTSELRRRIKLHKSLAPDLNDRADQCSITRIFKFAQPGLGA